MWAKCLLLNISLKHFSYVEMNMRNRKGTAAAVPHWERGRWSPVGMPLRRGQTNSECWHCCLPWIRRVTCKKYFIYQFSSVIDKTHTGIGQQKHSLPEAWILPLSHCSPELLELQIFRNSKSFTTYMFACFLLFPGIHLWPLLETG